MDKKAIAKCCGKTVQQVYEILDRLGVKKLMVDEIGIYNPNEHKEKFGDRYIISVAVWDEEEKVMYASIHI